MKNQIKQLLLVLALHSNPGLMSRRSEVKACQLFLARFPLLLLLSTLSSQLSTAHAQGAAFTCQGRLNDHGANYLYLTLPTENLFFRLKQ